MDHQYIELARILGINDFDYIPTNNIIEDIEIYGLDLSSANSTKLETSRETLHIITEHNKRMLHKILATNKFIEIYEFIKKYNLKFVDFETRFKYFIHKYINCKKVGECPICRDEDKKLLQLGCEIDDHNICANCILCLEKQECSYCKFPFALPVSRFNPSIERHVEEATTPHVGGNINQIINLPGFANNTDDLHSLLRPFVLINRPISFDIRDLEQIERSVMENVD
jgi:hypothetical protein